MLFSCDKSESHFATCTGRVYLIMTSNLAELVAQCVAFYTSCQPEAAKVRPPLPKALIHALLLHLISPNKEELARQSLLRSGSTLRQPVSDPINWPSEITPQKTTWNNFFGFTMAGTYLKHTGILWGGGITGEFSEL